VTNSVSASIDGVLPKFVVSALIYFNTVSFQRMIPFRQSPDILLDIVMVALWNRADHYIFALWFFSSSIFFSFLA